MKYEYITENNNLEITNLRMLFVKKKRDYATVKRKRKMEVIVYILEGKIRIVDEQSKFDFIADKGDIIYLPNGETTITSHIAEVNNYLIIKFESASDRLLGDAMIIKNGTSENVQATIETIVSQLENHREKNHMFFCMMTYKLLYNIQHQSKKADKHKFHKLFPVISEMRAHPEADRKISDYADMCQMSEVGFRKLFIEYTGKTPVEYRTELRLKMAEDMLIDGEYSVADAARLSGFNSMSFFCREFKRHYGYSAGNIK